MARNTTLDGTRKCTCVEVTVVSLLPYLSVVKWKAVVFWGATEKPVVGNDWCYIVVNGVAGGKRSIWLQVASEKRGGWGYDFWCECGQNLDSLRLFYLSLSNPPVISLPLFLSLSPSLPYLTASLSSSESLGEHGSSSILVRASAMAFLLFRSLRLRLRAPSPLVKAS
jgi:hypothetical protein